MNGKIEFNPLAETHCDGVPYRGEKTTSRRLVDPQQQSYERDHIILDESLIEKRIKHRGAEHRAGSEGQSEHV